MDERARLLVFEFFAGARSGADLATSAEFGDDLAYRAGTAIGQLHDLPEDGAVSGTDGEGPVLPSAALLESLPMPVFAHCSAAELHAWRLMQRDEPFAAAVRELLDREQRATHTPAHCDLRLEQLLMVEGTLYICDGEEFQLADPARDIGSFAGEWMHRAVVGLIGEGEYGALGQMFTPEKMVDGFAARIDQARQRIAAFWSGYQSVRPAADRHLAERAVGFAGWHLFDRMLAAARRSSRLGALERAAAGVGRRMMLAPQDFAATIGLELRP